ncbi:protein D2 isoform X3 [Leptinotarsa decemlineata]|uniref:protein D2 isoform X2 n=1 Tax=Leptinotarsa decemlineata TaxID=7539 RepID=UPI000C25276A|nr:protein D2-like isoform X1 [Leptinotarsa decemlineata]XP_023020260.1 protein D2-like isoform X2 [Leptinotarsa decemlineata]
MKEFKSNEVVPDVLNDAPDKLLEIKYKSGKDVRLGNELTPKQVLEAPEVKYEADSKDYYTLIFTDPDAPSRKNPKSREWNHWLVVNIPGSKILEGEVITDYVGSAPPKGSGLHRYVFVLYKQPEKLKVDEPRHGPTDGNRGQFSTEKFAKKYNLGKAVGGNFFQAQWDDSVPASHKKLGF